MKNIAKEPYNENIASNIVNRILKMYNEFGSQVKLKWEIEINQEYFELLIDIDELLDGEINNLLIKNKNICIVYHINKNYVWCTQVHNKYFYADINYDEINTKNKKIINLIAEKLLDKFDKRIQVEEFNRKKEKQKDIDKIKNKFTSEIERVYNIINKENDNKERI